MKKRNKNELQDAFSEKKKIIHILIKRGTGTRYFPIWSLSTPNRRNCGKERERPISPRTRLYEGLVLYLKPMKKLPLSLTLSRVTEKLREVRRAQLKRACSRFTFSAEQKRKLDRRIFTVILDAALWNRRNSIPSLPPCPKEKKSCVIRWLMDG